MTLNTTMFGLVSKRHGLIAIAIGLFGVIALLLVLPARAAQFEVNLFDPDPAVDAPDFDPGDGVCEVAPGGGCSLRAAIEQANANTEGDNIVFLGGGTITVAADLPVINSSNALTIDGWSAGGVGYEGPPLVQVDNAGAADNGFVLESNNNTLFGLSITGFNETGILITGARNQVYGSYIGLNPDGTTANGNGIGVQLQGEDADDNLIGSVNPDFRNIISGNDTVGISVIDVDSQAGSSGSWNFSIANRILNNYIGTNAAGDAGVGNIDGGIFMRGQVRYLIIGTPDNGNVISGNGGDAISVIGTTSRAMNIRGNFIGTNATGDATIPNTGDGIDFNLNQWNLIDSNLIGGNTGNGILISGDGVKASVCNNLIGINADGVALGNGSNGLLFNGGGLGVDGNYVGFSPVFGSISPPACTDGNTIAFNGDAGVAVTGTNRLVAVRGNSIFSNGGLGIELDDTANEGVTAPVLTNAGTDGTDIVLDVSLFQQAGLTGPQRSFQVHFYANTAVCDPGAAPPPEGEIYLGSINMDVDLTGFDERLSLVLNNSFIPGTSITATASARAIAPPNATGTIWRSTSEFSTCINLADATDLQIQKLASLDTVQTGGSLTYNLSVTNNSTTAATNVIVEDTLPANVTFVSVIPDLTTFPAPPYCEIALNIITCTLGTIAAGDSLGITINVNAPTSTGVIINRASVTSDQPDIRQRNNTSSALTFVEDPTPTPLPPPNDPLPTATDINAEATLTATVLQQATATASPTFTVTSTSTPTATASSTATATASPTATATSTSTSTATPTATASSTATATASPTATATSTSTSTATPTATASSTMTATPTVTQTATATLSPTPVLTFTSSPTAETDGLQMVKSLNEEPLEPDQVAFNVRVSNEGSAPVSNVVLIEQLLDGVELITVDAGEPVCTKTLETISCALGTLAGGSSTQVNFVVQTDGQANPLLGRSIVRSAELPDITLTEPYIIKLASPAFLQSNGEATWTIRLLNPGAEPATNVLVTDTIPDQLEIISATATTGTIVARDGRVTFQLARLGPVSAATITIRTRLIDNSVRTPIITNRACLQTAQRPQQQCVQAPVFRVDQLPNTGESPFSGLRWLLVLLPLSLAIGILWQVKRRLARGTQQT